jgi:salicylate hydroxylase
VSDAAGAARQPARARAIVVGGGIGGLCAALALAREGFGVTVLEQSAAFGDVGAGIQLSPNATRVLHHLGLEAPLRAVAFLPEGTEMRGWRRGHVIATAPLGEAVRSRYGHPYYHVHRADLLGVLAQAAGADPAIRLLTGTRVESVVTDDERARVQAGGQTHEAELLVGADGIHSRVREQLFGAQAPRFTGNVAWRGLIPADRLPPGLVRPMATAWWGPQRHFVHYYVRRGELVNCVCVVEKEGWELESWTERGDLAELRRDFAGWHRDVQALIDAMDPQACFRWALFDRAPMPRWSRGVATLLGDACHPTLPFMAQGAAMAIEDAAVLARFAGQGLAEGALARALLDYETVRRPRVSGIQAGSRRNATVFHLSGIRAWLRDRAVAKARGAVMDGIYRYDALRVARPASAAPA